MAKDFPQVQVESREEWRAWLDANHESAESLSTLPSATGTGTIQTKLPYQFASGVLLKSNVPAIIAESVFITSDYEGLRLSDGTGTRQQQIAEALKSGIESYLAANPPQPDGDTGGHPKGGPPGRA